MKSPTCTRCGGPGPFPPQKRKKNGLSSWCRECYRRKTRAYAKANPEKRTRAWRKAHPRILKGSKRLHGMTQVQFDVLLVQQKNRCGICADPLGQGKARHIDHDHKTNKVRSILCTNCNTGLGQFKEDPKRLLRAVAYLRRFNGGN